MAFNEIVTRARARRDMTRDPDGVSIAIYDNSRRAMEPRHTLTVFIGANLLRSMGLKTGDRVTVSEGDGPDHGLFRIMPAPPGVAGLTLTSKKDYPNQMSSVSVRVALLRTLCNVPTSYVAEPTTFQRFGSALVFAVPWCHAPVDVDSAPVQESLV